MYYMHAQNDPYTTCVCEFIVLMGKDIISWQNLCPIPFVNLTNKIIINLNVCFCGHAIVSFFNRSTK
jgi:hypothetical protein